MINSVSVIVHADLDDIVLVNDVVHISIDKVCIEGAALFVNHKGLFLLGYYTHLLIIVNHIKICTFLQRAEFIVKYSLIARIPKSTNCYQNVISQGRQRKMFEIIKRM